MRILREVIKNILEEQCNQDYYWGVGGAGIVLICSEDGTVFLQKRSSQVTGGAGQWAFPGGGIHVEEEYERHWESPIPDEHVLSDNDYRFLQTAEDEFTEEVGTLPDSTRVVDSYIYEDCGFKYKTFICDVSFSGKQSLGSGGTNWESEANGWFTVEEFQGKDLFFGFTPGLVTKILRALS
jgi:8-oxo-dGTP pyrophosphatase MutT (NUDIX family)